MLLIELQASLKPVGLFILSGVTVSMVEAGPYRLAIAIALKSEVVSPINLEAKRLQPPRESTGRAVLKTSLAAA